MTEVAIAPSPEKQLKLSNDRFAALVRAGIATGGADLTGRTRAQIGKATEAARNADGEQQVRSLRGHIGLWSGYDTSGRDIPLERRFTEIIGDRLVTLDDTTSYSAEHNNIVQGVSVLRVNPDPRAVQLWQGIQGTIENGADDVSWLQSVGGLRAVLGLRPDEWYKGEDDYRKMIAEFLWSHPSTQTIQDDTAPDSNVCGVYGSLASTVWDYWDNSGKGFRRAEMSIRTNLLDGLAGHEFTRYIEGGKFLFTPGRNNAARRFGILFQHSKNEPGDLEALFRLVGERESVSFATTALRKRILAFNQRRELNVPGTEDVVVFNHGILGEYEKIAGAYEKSWLSALDQLAKSAVARREGEEVRQRVEVQRQWQEEWVRLINGFAVSASGDLEYPFVHKFIDAIHGALVELELTDSRKTALERVNIYMGKIPKMISEEDTDPWFLYAGLLRNGGTELGLPTLEDFRKKHPTLDISTSPVI